MESFLNVYENERRIPQGIRELHIPIVDRMLVNEPNYFMDNYDSPIRSPMRTLTLKKCPYSLHVSYELLEDQLNIELNARESRGEAVSHLRLLAVFLERVSRVANNTLKELQPIEGGHPVIIQRVAMGNQYVTQQVVLNIDFWALELESADIAAVRRKRYDRAANFFNSFDRRSFHAFYCE